MPPMGISTGLGLGVGDLATAGGGGGGGGGGGASALEEVAIADDTSTLNAVTGQAEAFVAYNDETLQLWVSAEMTTALKTYYTKQDA